LTSIFEYDIQTDSWKTKNNLILGRWALSTCSADNMIFILGGMTVPLDLGKNSVEVYFPLKDSIVGATAMVKGRSSLSSCIFQNKIYSFGGVNTPYPWVGTCNFTEAGIFK